MSEKPIRATINQWECVLVNGVVCIRGMADVKGWEAPTPVRTSYVVSITPYGGTAEYGEPRQFMLETRNSRYILGTPNAPEAY